MAYMLYHDRIGISYKSYLETDFPNNRVSISTWHVMLIDIIEAFEDTVGTCAIRYIYDNGLLEMELIHQGIDDDSRILCEVDIVVEDRNFAMNASRSNRCRCHVCQYNRRHAFPEAITIGDESYDMIRRDTENFRRILQDVMQ